MKNGFRFGKDADAERADDHAGRQIAKDGTKPHALEDRHGDNTCGEQRHHVDQIAARCFCRHACRSVLFKDRCTCCGIERPR